MRAVRNKIRPMRYWWVNQNQRFRHEFEGGYLWCHKPNANGSRNPFYETMCDVSPGDLISSFVDTRIAAHRRLLLLRKPETDGVRPGRCILE
jgi:hypothetical protein